MSTPITINGGFSIVSSQDSGSQSTPLSSSTPFRASPDNAQSLSQRRTSGQIGLQKRRASSFTSASSPWARRRSFLSTSMMSNEKHSVYEMSSHYYGASSLRSVGGTSIPCYSMSLRESQGFIWNQDLFASQYQQARALLHQDDDSDEEDTPTASRSYSSSRYSDTSGIGKVEVVDIVLSDGDFEEEDEEDEEIFKSDHHQ
ncbi:unnamed protein product [Kuraishia capsulata CBS 1993]|uniref:Uncharacterized protein n=1 Tax=Kuraishia capsulata CBS 1993 TaxID=1382522 RepID=W6MR57_9ASCO|nr:uncharacterized protein KUCA_T00000306001 [Kuraishia capsulata CBS 1993]CDK24345.1 unnamed protein product [Kuraishia capsulata CBS 1993]